MTATKQCSLPMGGWARAGAVVLLIGLTAACVMGWRLQARSWQLFRVARYTAMFSVGMARADVSRLLGTPVAEVRSREELVKRFPDYPVPQTKVENSVLCFQGGGKTPSSGDLGLFYLDSRDIVTSLFLLEGNQPGASRR